MPAAIMATECPICQTEVSAEAMECPRCGEMFVDLPLTVHGRVPGGSGSPGRPERFLYYAGILLILLGGPGVALGSWLHDVLRISFLNYDAFDVFGQMNRLVLAVGLIMVVVGAAFLLLSARSPRSARSAFDA